MITIIILINKVKKKTIFRNSSGYVKREHGIGKRNVRIPPLPKQIKREKNNKKREYNIYTSSTHNNCYFHLPLSLSLSETWVVDPQSFPTIGFEGRCGDLGSSKKNLLKKTTEGRKKRKGIIHLLFYGMVKTHIGQDSK